MGVNRLGVAIVQRGQGEWVAARHALRQRDVVRRGRAAQGSLGWNHVDKIVAFIPMDRANPAQPFSTFVTIVA